MERYKMIKEVGDGTFGSVWRAINKQNSEVVAVKKMKKKYYSWEECMGLREVKSLRRMSHPNIVKLKEVIREHDILYFVMEYMECNLYQLMKDRVKGFSEVEVRNWCFQIFHALSYMHQRGYFHRDLKPENLLVSKDTIKLADFGLSREVASVPPYTEYVSTRWYRAPEVLLQSSVYDSAVDMWAMGAIMAELFTLRPLFPGSSEADEILKICNVIGSPTKDSWEHGLHLAESMRYQFPQTAGNNLSELFPSVSADAVDLISSLCSWDPCKRPKASEALQHAFFKPCLYVPPSLRSRVPGAPKTPPVVGTRGVAEQTSARRYSTGALSASKPSGNFLAVNSSTSGASKTGVQRKLEMSRQTSQKSTRTTETTSSTRQSITNKMPAKISPARISRNVPEPARVIRSKSVTDKFSQMSLASAGRQSTKPSAGLLMKAGHGKSDFLAKPDELPQARRYTRRAA